MVRSEMQILNFKTERQIFKRIRENDRDVLGELFLKYEKMVTNYVLKNGGNHDDAEDILQEAIIVLWQRINSGHFEVKSKISTFIFSVAKNKWMSELRKKKRMTVIDEETDLEAEADIMGNLLTNEELDMIESVMGKLSEICRKLLHLFYFEERKMDEIAEMLGLANVNVAKSKKYQCKKSLEDLLKGVGAFNGL